MFCLLCLHYNLNKSQTKVLNNILLSWNLHTATDGIEIYMYFLLKNGNAKAFYEYIHWQEIEKAFTIIIDKVEGKGDLDPSPKRS